MEIMISRWNPIPPGETMFSFVQNKNSYISHIPKVAHLACLIFKYTSIQSNSLKEIGTKSHIEDLT